MKYYSIQHSLNKKILGHYPQIKKIIHNCDIWEDSLFIDKFQHEKIDIKPIISNPVLHSKSKLIDLIDVRGEIGFVNKILIGTKLKSILEKKKPSGLQFFQCSVFKDGIEYDDYWILNYYEINYEFLDYKKSEIFITNNIFDKTSKLEVNNADEFVEKKNEIDLLGYPNGILIDNVVINKDVNIDFFMLNNVESGTKYVVSEKLKKEIDDANCIGIEFQPIELSTNEWLHGGERERIYGKV